MTMTCPRPEVAAAIDFLVEYLHSSNSGVSELIDLSTALYGEASFEQLVDLGEAAVRAHIDGLIGSQVVRPAGKVPTVIVWQRPEGRRAAKGIRAQREAACL